MPVYVTASATCADLIAINVIWHALMSVYYHKELVHITCYVFFLSFYLVKPSN
uniref:Uncharacterized protein n=1 Tax=Rhizophora mucronata TaxID=61149 RepID=A0A2P2P264_RHIMU